MDKQTDLQFELFSGEKNLPLSASNKRGPSFFKRMRDYEKIILMIIGITLTAIISFSLGVEKGKKIASLNTNSRFDLGMQTQQPLPKQAVKQPAPVILQPQLSIKNNSTDKQEVAEKNLFTIQLASYKTKSHAEKEAQALKKKGLSPLILTKGSYIVLCVGSFSNKETAQSLLTQLEKRYNGCRLRRL